MLDFLVMKLIRWMCYYRRVLIFSNLTSLLRILQRLVSSLQKLEIKDTNIPRVVSIITGLPSLEYLKLEDELDFDQSPEWCLGDITFHKLKLLKLEELDISRWDASAESFPLLETLVITRCYKLQEIPLSFADVSTLKHIKLIECNNQSLEASAVRIKEEVEAIEGCDRINITIQNIYQEGI